MFDNREQAGELLAQHLVQYRKRKDVVVLGIPRGGVVTAKAIADALNLPLDIVVVRKIGAPHNPELAIGAIGPKGVTYWDETLCTRIDVHRDQKKQLKQAKVIDRREREYRLRKGKPPRIVRNYAIILVDDGIATGATIFAALKYLRKEGAKELILAVPVIPYDTLRDIERYFDTVITLETPEEFQAVGQFYEEFPQVSDEEVIKLLST